MTWEESSPARASRIIVLWVSVQGASLGAGSPLCGAAVSSGHARNAFGTSIAMAGDVNGDGTPDILAVGEKAEGEGGGDSRGRAFVFSGKDGRLLMTLGPPDRRVGGEPGWEGPRDVAGEFGYSLVFGGLGDMDGDGRPDLAVGAQGLGFAESVPAAVYFLSSKDGSPLRTLHEGTSRDYFGLEAAVLPDLDRDGTRDIAVGARLALSEKQQRVGAVHVFSGKKGVLLRSLWGEQAGELFGIALAEAGDVDLDGTPDLVVGAPFSSVASLERAGRVEVFSGKDGSSLVRLQGGTKEGHFGAAVASIGDVDGDGRPEFAVGAPFEAFKDLDSPGRVVAASGKGGRLLWERRGTTKFNRLGHAVLPLGDVNGDGSPDVAVSCASLDDSGSARTGSVLVLSGKDGATIRELDHPVPTGVSFGESLVALGDLDGDHVVDFAVGAPGDFSPGSILVYSGKSGALLITLRNPTR